MFQFLSNGVKWSVAGLSRQYYRFKTKLSWRMNISSEIESNINILRIFWIPTSLDLHIYSFQLIAKWDYTNERRLVPHILVYTFHSVSLYRITIARV